MTVDEKKAIVVEQAICTHQDMSKRVPYPVGAPYRWVVHCGNCDAPLYLLFRDGYMAPVATEEELLKEAQETLEGADVYTRTLQTRSSKEPLLWHVSHEDGASAACRTCLGPCLPPSMPQIPTCPHCLAVMKERMWGALKGLLSGGRGKLR